MKDEAPKLHMDDFETFLTATDDARRASERDRDYVDHKQWTAEEEEKLTSRGQSPVVINKMKTKVNVLSGIQRQRRTDPKALPRTPKHEKDADSVTDALRFVADDTDLPHTSSEVFTDEAVWGYGGAIVEVMPRGDEFEVQVNYFSPDRFYFDPFSRRLDFKDGRYMGIVVWMRAEEAKELFPEKKDDIDALLTGTADSMAGTTFEDKPLWVDRVKQRIRICQHFYREKGKWMECVFGSNLYLVEPKESTYHDEHGEPTNPIEAQTAYIDRDNNRYGEMRAYVWPQDEVNHRRSKALYLLSVRQTKGEKGAVDNIDHMKAELARADGHVEVNPGKEFDLLDTSDFTTGQFELYRDAMSNFDSIGANAALSGTHEQNLSGRAIQALQQGGIAEVGGLFDGHIYWEKRVYRQIWARIKQFWTGERWIRVTDNEDNLRWVTLNQPITLGMKLKEAAEQGDQQAQQMLQQFLDDPRLNQVVEVRNNTSELDVDVVLTQSADYATIRQEQFETMADLAKAYGPEAVPFEVMLRLSDMTNKEEVLDLLKQDEESQVDPVQQQAQQALMAEVAEIGLREKAAKADQAEAQASKTLADAEAQMLENQVVQATGLKPDAFKTSLSTGS